MKQRLADKMGWKRVLHVESGKKIPISPKIFNNPERMMQLGYVTIEEPSPPDEVSTPPLTAPTEIGEDGPEVEIEVPKRKRKTKV